MIGYLLRGGDCRDGKTAESGRAKEADASHERELDERTRPSLSATILWTRAVSELSESKWMTAEGASWVVVDSIVMIAAVGDEGFS